MDIGQVRKILGDAANDLTVYAGDKGMTYLVADRLRRLSKELDGKEYLTDQN